MKHLWYRLVRWRRFRGHQRKGDAARARRDWPLAARHYRRHLSRHPLDHGIWIQFGHALKEAGKPSRALEAYREADRLRGDDPDLLLHMGHLVKGIGDFSKARDYFAASARIAPTAAILAELRLVSLKAGGGVPVRPGDPVDRLFHDLGSGLEALASNDLAICGDSMLCPEGPDPWLEFAVDPAVTSAPVAAWRAMTRGSGLATSLNSRIYVDRGGGYAEADAIIVESSSNATDVLIVAPRLIRTIRWVPDDSDANIRLTSFSLLPLITLSDASEILAADGAFSDAIRRSGQRTLSNIYASHASLTVAQAASAQSYLQPSVDLRQFYHFWSSSFEEPSVADYHRIREMTAQLPVHPFFSFVVPVYNTPLDLLAECLRSMLDQVYPHFEICIADDHSDAPGVSELLRTYAAQDPRVRVVFREQNGHIAAASNSALALARGDFVVLVDHDDIIPDYALFVVADAVNGNPAASIFFSDEDKIDVDGRCHSPYFKGDFNRFLIYGQNMISHLGVYRRSIVERVGGFREGLEGSQDYDLFLRCYEVVGENGVVHIPHILYHWRTTPGSTAISHDQKSYAIVAAQRAINDHFDRTGQPLRSIDSVILGHSAVIARPGHEARQRASVIICTRDRKDLIEPCLATLRRALRRGDEIIIVDNGTTDRATRKFLDGLARTGSAKVLRQPSDFNFSSLNNAGAAAASGELLCFLNNDTETVDAGWLDRARLLLTLPDVGVVGARLLYPDGRVQHFGIGLGMAAQGVAGVLNVGLDRKDPGYFGKARLLQQFSAVTAACMIVRRDEFLMLGGFDPSLAVAYNDVDLCLRFGKAGYKVVCDPDIELIHKESVSRGLDLDGERLARLDREAAIMRRRWSEVLPCDPFLSPNQDLGQSLFTLAYPPRVPVPWRRPATERGQA